MRRGRAPSREPRGSGGPRWDDPDGQLPATGIPGDTGDSLYRSSSLRRRCENHVRELRTFFTLSQSHASRVLLL